MGMGMGVRLVVKEDTCRLKVKAGEIALVRVDKEEEAENKELWKRYVRAKLV